MTSADDSKVGNPSPVAAPDSGNIAPARPWLRNALLALSFANLAFFRSWQLCLDSAYDYYASSVPVRAIDATMLGVLMLAAIAWAVMFALAKLQSRPIARLLTWIAFTAVLLLNPLASYIPGYLDWYTGGFGPVITVSLGLVVAFLFVIWQRQITRMATLLLLVASPLVLMTYSQALWKRFGPTPADLRTPAHLSLTQRRSQQRVVWLVFDEFDEALAFSKRPPSVKMPEFDRLREESWVAEHAFPPADETLASIPSMFIGTTVKHPKVKRADNLKLRFQDQRPDKWWSEEPSPFDTARSIGVNSALVGWYHPYCRLFGARVSSCYQARVPLFDELGGCSDCAPDLPSAIADRALSILPYRTAAMTAYRSRWSRAVQVAEIPESVEKAKSIAADPRFGFVYIHLGIPHPPAMYSRSSGKLTEIGSYLDNLAFTDLVLGKLRSAMVSSGVWDSTTIVICGDHWFRYNLHSLNGLISPEDRPSGSMQVPVIIRVSNQATAVRYNKSFNTAILGKLVERLLLSASSSNEQISSAVDDLSREVPWNAITHNAD